ncbi:O-antigen ligase family protein [Virgibacillus sp. 179-BFC.A HS]|uniref:O-antigen ligase family protein n=1 Tax=Tigheibacillus jepli TaxID=3035914 RepID=A0ABU5CEH5_9BACI|nr:O-antigen ligase family protein [Virgibacillus sp. 179-BFC.A HS]MDY0404734.1 O-antigen ligase family protein [Virgibacillus sp. 179-BFC.A HS]
MEQKRNRWIFVLIILQPVIDLITSLTTKYANAAISLGALFKMILMVFLFFYLLFYFWKEKRGFLPFFLLSYAAIVAMLMITVVGKPNIFFFAEVNFAFKTAYYLTLLYTVIMWYLRKIAINALLYQAVTIVSLIVGVTYWIAVLTGTSINSYTYVKPGFSGWFYSANELSVTVIVLLALSMLNVFENAKATRNQGHPIWTDWLAFLLMVSMIPMVGTKTAYAGGILLLLFYGAALLIRTRFFFGGSGVFCNCCLSVCFLYC